VADVAGLVREKQRLRAALLARTIAARPELTESRDAGPPAGPFVYNYQRFDLRVRGRRVFEEVYPLDPRGGISLGVWGGSGMGVITAALRVLDARLERPRRFLLSQEAYFETHKVTLGFRQLLVNDDDDRFLPGDHFYLDSVTSQDRFPLLIGQPLAPLELVLFDTTCYDRASPLIDRVVARCRAEGVPLLLLRSHLKLDCLATEYARLGSAVLLLPPRPTPAVVALARTLRSDLRDELALAGAMPTPAAFWPLAADPRARRLDAARIARMVAAQARAAAALEGGLRRVRLEAPHHGCFLLIKPFPVRRHAWRRALAELAAHLRAGGIEAGYLPSFGYDVAAVTCFEEVTGGTLRLAVPDLPDDAVDCLAARVAAFLDRC
jgi:hypothetical protein